MGYEKKKTLQELADFLGMIVAVDEDRSTYAYEDEPTMRPYGDDWQDDGYWYSEGFEYCISEWMVNYHGSWEGSLTFPNEEWAVLDADIEQERLKGEAPMINLDDVKENTQTDVMNEEEQV